MGAHASSCYRQYKTNASLEQSDKKFYEDCKRYISSFSFEKHSLSLMSEVVRAKRLIESAQIAPLCRHERRELENIKQRLEHAITL